MAKVIKTVQDIVGVDENNHKKVIPNTDNVKGIYAIGIDDPIKEERTIVKAKIGLGGLNEAKEGGLLKRIRSYYICFPDGVWIYCVLQIKRYVRIPEGFLRKIEKEVFAELKSQRYNTEYKTWTTHRPEWFMASIKSIRNAFRNVAHRHPDYLEVLFPNNF